MNCEDGSGSVENDDHVVVGTKIIKKKLIELLSLQINFPMW